MTQPLLELRGVNKSFGVVHVLHDVDFAVYPGQVTALVGDNGAGKSTLVKIIAGIYGRDSGDYLFDGNPVTVHSPKDVAELGVVMFLFIIGLEMQPTRLWSMRRDIFGLGALQVAACIVILMAVGIAFGQSPAVAFVAGTGFVLTSTEAGSIRYSRNGAAPDTLYTAPVTIASRAHQQHRRCDWPTESRPVSET